MSKTIQKEDMTVIISRYWPLNAIRRIEITVDNGSIINKAITLDKSQAENLYIALKDILGKDLVS